VAFDASGLVMLAELLLADWQTFHEEKGLLPQDGQLTMVGAIVRQMIVGANLHSLVQAADHRCCINTVHTQSLEDHKVPCKFQLSTTMMQIISVLLFEI